MSPSSLESVAVATVAYNSSSHLGPFLSSLRAGEDASLTVIVADNGSRDIEQTRQFAQEHDAQLLELGENLGYGGAVNAAVRAMPERIRYVLVSNPDVMIEPGAVTELVRAFERLPEAGAVGPRVLNEDGTVYPSARKLPSLRTGVGHAVFSGIWPSNPWTRSYREDQEGSGRERVVGWLSGSFVMVSREAFDALGGFDEGFFMYFEDVDLGYRLGKHGYKSVYVPSAEVIHTGAHSTTTESARMIQVHHDSAYRYLSKKYAGPVLAPLRWTLRAGLAVRSRYLIAKAQRSR
ncbi:glycosyltransferase family 2 protein [Leifsonia sp. NPDC058292]|uniref:glycosyltransferase family 2 protein n=1 Tax=Leifsonia sp. NPDC058292 TaxID=3346428 RepID=UPI0036D86105